jgi:hypothetical protein
MTHYDVLEVSPRASAEVIRAAYKSLMQRYHPDKNPATSDMAKTASLIVQAYEVVGDPGKRAAYDLELDAMPRMDVSAYGPAAGAGRASRAATYGALKAAPYRRTWLAWVIIICVIAAGAAILLQSRKHPATSKTVPEQQAAVQSQAGGKPAPSAADSATPDATRSAASPAPPVENPVERDAPTVALLSIPLRIEIAAYDSASVPHTLQIPEISVRVDAPDALRWARKIETQRGDILRQLLERLGDLDYLQLLKPDGELYLKRAIAGIVADVVDYRDPPPPPSQPPPLPGAIVPPPPRPFVVFLPQSYSVR